MDPSFGGKFVCVLCIINWGLGQAWLHSIQYVTCLSPLGVQIGVREREKTKRGGGGEEHEQRIAVREKSTKGKYCRKIIINN